MLSTSVKKCSSLYYASIDASSTLVSHSVFTVNYLILAVCLNIELSLMRPEILKIKLWIFKEKKYE